jgi:hypothetical protein
MIRTTPAIAGAIALLAFTSLGACSRPLTDIVATDTEDVGDFSVSGTREGDALRATVCVANPGRADAVVDRVLQQLFSRGLHTIVLDLYSERRPIKRVVWRSGARTDEPLDGEVPAGICAGSTERSS